MLRASNQVSHVQYLAEGLKGAQKAFDTNKLSQRVAVFYSDYRPFNEYLLNSRKARIFWNQTRTY